MAITNATTCFKDRREAGASLVALLRERGERPDVVLGVARGGVVVASVVAEALGAELGAVAVRKLVAPWNPEFSVGAVASGVPAFVDHERVRRYRVDVDHVLAECDRQQRECVRQDADFARFGVPSLRGRRVLVVDDALVTGASAVAAVRRARRLGAETIAFAAPVAAPAAVARLEQEGVRSHCLALDPGLAFPAANYERFERVDEGAVCRLLARSRDARPIASRLLTIDVDGTALPAAFELPEGAGPFPAVVLAHGAGENKDSPRITSLAARLRARGLATLRFDSCVGAACLPPAGDPLRATRELAAVFLWTLSAPEVDARRIALFGHGLGAWGALVAAREGQVGPAALALSSPPLQYSDLEGLDVPCLLVVGDQDPNLRAVVTAAATRKDSRVEIVAGGHYGFRDERATESAAQHVGAWLAQRLLRRNLAAT
jgi:predicted phosphoribosyltransferase/dienelactone hydrolase